MSPVPQFTRALAGTLVALAACSHTPPASGPMADAAVRRDLEKVRAATAPYRDLAAAQAAGYPTSTPPCLSNATAGGMGHHYVKRDIVDAQLDLEHPEILLYAPDGEGKQKLVAVEYIIPYRLLPRESEAPRILGQALRQGDELKLWYLHVWAWEENSAGLFANWNPAVKCPAP